METTKANVWLLPTKEKSNIRLNTALKLIDNTISDYGIENNIHLTFAHLYFTLPQSNLEISKIKKGDWYYSKSIDCIFQAVRFPLPCKDAEKIVATTNKDIQMCYVRDDDPDKLSTHTNLIVMMSNFPFIPQSFIDFIDENLK
jgi:hypothetical protein